MEQFNKMSKGNKDSANFSLPASPKGTSMMNMDHGLAFSRSIYFDSNFYDDDDLVHGTLNMSRSDDAIFHDFADAQQSLYGNGSSFKYLRSNILPGACPHHMDSDEYIDANQMKKTLAKLSNDFNSGKLQAFGENVTLESMLKIREQQENLARLHHELNLQQTSKEQMVEIDIFNDNHSNSIMTKLFSKSNMQKLIQNLQNLCKSIDRLQLKNAKESNGRY